MKPERLIDVASLPLAVLALLCALAPPRQAKGGASSLSVRSLKYRGRNVVARRRAMAEQAQSARHQWLSLVHTVLLSFLFLHPRGHQLRGRYIPTGKGF